MIPFLLAAASVVAVVCAYAAIAGLVYRWLKIDESELGRIVNRQYECGCAPWTTPRNIRRYGPVVSTCEKHRRSEDARLRAELWPVFILVWLGSPVGWLFRKVAGLPK